MNVSMRRSFVGVIFVVVVAVSLSMASTARAGIISYSEIFTHRKGEGGATGSTALSEQDWKSNVGTGGSSTGPTVSSIQGAEEKFGVNSSPPYPNLPSGNDYGYMAYGASSSDRICWTDEYNAGDIGNVESIQWRQSNNSASDLLHVAIRIGDSAWYASSSTFSTSTGTDSYSSPGGRSWVLNTLTMSGAAWKTLDFVPGSSLELKGTATLPTSGDLTAFGLYANIDSIGTRRIDSYEITVVPEPSSLVVLLGLGGLSLAVYGWRRRKRR